LPAIRDIFHADIISDNTLCTALARDVVFHIRDLISLLLQMPSDFIATTALQHFFTPS